jgi:hypothetical protein
MLAVILREDCGGIRELGGVVVSAGISKYAEPEAEGIIEVWRTGEVSAVKERMGNRRAVVARSF